MSDDKRVSLGHTRLSIIDLSTGDQPISDRQGNTHLTANGEFYDYEKIREELIKLGHEFKTNSDSEIALHLYRQYGTSCLEHLRGEFAFCLWDANNQFLFVARDRVGIKPLYYSFHEGVLYVASEIKAILAAGVPAYWDEESYMSRAYKYRDRTLFKNVYQVPPGHFLIATSGGYRIVKYWDFNYPEDGCEAYKSEDEAAEDLKQVLLESTKMRLRADVPVSVYLSGGVDSCAVLGMAAEYSDKKLDTFTLSFSDSAYDESLAATEMAETVGANSKILSVKEDELADNFSDTLWYTENFCINSHNVAKYLLSKFVRKNGYKVVLTGEGSDEVQCGYPSFRLDLARESGDIDRINALYETNSVSAGALLPSDEVGSHETTRLSNAIGFFPSWLMPQLEMIKKLRSLYTESMLDKYGTMDPLWQFLVHQDVSGQLNGINNVHKSMYLMSKSLLPNYILRSLGDGVEMANSIEGRVPFLDHKVIEKTVNMPVSMKIKGTVEKNLLRKAVREFIPESVFYREKHPFLAPPSAFNTKSRLFQFIQDMVCTSTSDVPFIDRKKAADLVESMVDAPRDKQVAAEPIIMEMLSICIMHDRFKMRL